MFRVPKKETSVFCDTSVPCSNVQSLYIIITEYRWKFLYLSREIIFLLGFTLLLWLHYRRRMSASPVALLHPSVSCASGLQLTIPICLMSLCTSYFHLASGVPVCRCWFELGWYIFLVFLASFNCRRYPLHLKHWSWIEIPLLTSLYNIFVLHRGANTSIRHISLILLLQHFLGIRLLHISFQFLLIFKKV